MRTRWLILSFLAFTLVAEGRTPKGLPPLPLMPDREAEAELLLDGPEAVPPAHVSAPAPVTRKYAMNEKRRYRSPDYALSAESSRQRKSSVLMGFELGTVGRSNSTSPDALGMKLMWGGRAFAILPVGKKIYLKPSVGFFYRHEGVAKVGISESVAEGGLNVQYCFSQSNGLNWFVGGVSRLDVAFSRTSISTLEANPASGTAESGAPLLRYRFGPSVGLTYRVSPEIGLLLDGEVTVTFTKPVKPYGGLVGGLIFRL